MFGELNLLLLGFDYGIKRIGVAVGQNITGTATSLTTLYSKHERPDWKNIEYLIREWQPQKIIVGLPYNMDNTETVISEKAKRFTRQLHGRYHIPTDMIDERLTSIEARRYFSNQSETNRWVDAKAAALILETWLNR